MTDKKKDNRKQKGQKAAELKQRVQNYKKKQQINKKGKKPKNTRILYLQNPNYIC